MTTYNTGNAVPSANAKDRYDNSQTFDEVVNALTETTVNRVGRTIYTFAGMESAFNVAQFNRATEYTADKLARDTEFAEDQAERVVEFNEFLESSGYEIPVDYVAGLNITRPTQVIRFSGELYRAKDASLPFVTTTWATDSPKFFSMGDASLRQELADPDNALIAFLRGPFAQSRGTIAGMLSAQTLNVWEYDYLIPLGDKVVLGDPATWYWDYAINGALQEGKKVLLTEMFKIRRKIATKVTGAQLVGDGITSAGLVLDQLGSPGASFTGNVALELGDSSVAAATTTHLGVEGISINMGGRDIPGVAILGARDGSYATRVYITNFTKTAFRTNMAGDGVGVAAGKMCEGMVIEQIIAFPQNGVTTDIFLMDGIFESEASGCKAFGYTLAENNAVGFSVGKYSETRGLKLSSCSAANMVKFGNPANVNKAVVYGEWSKDNWDYNFNWENVEGGGVEFHGGTASGQLLPLNCRSVDPRPYFSANAEVLNPLYKFRKAASCYAEGVNYYSTVKATFEFTNEGGLNNYGILQGGVNPESLISAGVVVFAVGSSNSNFVAGHSSAVSIRKEFVLTIDQQFYRVLANGASEQSDQFWSTFNLGPPGKIRWRNNALETVASLDDTGLTTGKTALTVKLIKNGVTAFDRIELGALDSAGVGYRTLRIPN